MSDPCRCQCHKDDIALASYCDDALCGCEEEAQLSAEECELDSDCCREAHSRAQ